MITTRKIRDKFISYFRSKNHSHQPSSSLIPIADETLLFTNAGMVQFKDVFLGARKSDFLRAVTVQKCLRAGGKHNDLDNVGYTARHHTFFEMLGNFSFGDYFKKDAVSFAWEFLTEEIKLPKDRLWVTIYATDDETFNIWHNYIGLSRQRIIRIDSADNFWSMAETGPCGPCTEIFYDHDGGAATGLPGTSQEDNDRYIEIWNIVFMQYNRCADGSIVDLPKPSVDTGMGLERITTVLQGVKSNYDIDLFQALIKRAQQITNAKDVNSVSLKVIADHIRSCAFLIADGVLPSNETRGYVLRRIIRRAIRHGNKLGATKVFFYQLVDELIRQMGQAYPQLIQKQDLIEKTLINEEKLFLKTIENGIKIFETEVLNLKGNTISGQVAFKLYDTYGFPFDLTVDMAKEKNLKVDQQGFQKQMQIQKQRSKKHAKFGKFAHDSVIKSKFKSEFRGYSSFTEQTRIAEIYKDTGELVEHITNQETAVVVLDKTPFYPESGGQVADKGILQSENTEFIVKDVQKHGDAILHFGKLVKGSLNNNDKITAKVDSQNRLAIAINHSATHLLHKALKVILGNNVEQKGSLVDDKKLRFDFTHNQIICNKQIQQLELLINQQIRANCLVNTLETSQQQARLMGAEGLFDDKYKDIVRVVCMGDFSVEFCGGTHVSRTGDIGLFKIISESAIASGIRRIEAVTAEQALNYTFKTQDKILAIKDCLKADDINILDKLRSLVNHAKDQEKQINKLKKDILSRSKVIEELKYGDITLAIANIDDVDIRSLREKIDDYKSKTDNIVVVLSTIAASKVQFVVGVGKSVTSLIKANDIAKQLGNYIDGKGGGRVDLAQGGGNDYTNIDKALSQIKRFILGILNIKE